MIRRADVERVLDSGPSEDGLIVLGPDMRLVADRAPLPGGHAAIVVLDTEPFSYVGGLGSLRRPSKAVTDLLEAVSAGPAATAGESTPEADSRPVWVCAECGVAVRNAHGQPILKPTGCDTGGVDHHAKGAVACRRREVSILRRTLGLKYAERARRGAKGDPAS